MREISALKFLFYENYLQRSRSYTSRNSENGEKSRYYYFENKQLLFQRIHNLTIVYCEIVKLVQDILAIIYEEIFQRWKASTSKHLGKLNTVRHPICRTGNTLYSVISDYDNEAFGKPTVLLRSLKHNKLKQLFPPDGLKTLKFKKRKKKRT